MRKRRPETIRRNRRGHNIRRGIGFAVMVVLIGMIAVIISAGIGAFSGIIATAPDIAGIDVTPTGYATFVYDSDGNQTAKLVATDANRIPVTMDMVPKDLQHAFVAIEDERFYDHHGIDVQGILRAAFKGLTSGHFSEGASTITQQLIKNSVFTGWTNETFSESLRRKIQEQYLAVQLEKTMSKDNILLNYMNTINLGHNTLGVQAASQRYFGKSCSQLNLSECAVIAGITQNPTRFDPINYPENNASRRKDVLDKMLSQGWIDQSQYDEAMADNVYARIQVVNTDKGETAVNSYFVDALTDQVLADLQKKGYTETQAYTLLYSGGLNIYSTQNPRIQAIADEEANDPDNYPAGTKWYLNYQLSVEAVDDTITNYSTETMLSWMKENGLGYNMLFADEESAYAMAQQYKDAMVGTGDNVLGEAKSVSAQPQISLTIEDQRTGEVVALVGGRGQKTASRTLNRATSTLRQPGSTFKVVSTYAPALDAAGKTLATTYEDAPYAYENGTPVRNWYGEAYRGTTTIRRAIQDSMNIIAVKTLTDITPQLGYEYLLNFGFTTLVDREEIGGAIYSDITQTMALGGLTRGVTNIELNGAYATIANGGEYLEPKLYSQVTDRNGNVVLTADNRTKRRVLKESTSWLLTSAMKDVVTKGTGTRCQISETPVAGKTGTTSDENDVWFAGYSNYFTCTTWAGYDENTNLMGSESGIAKTLWQAVMERVHEGYEYQDFSMPGNVAQASICSLSGKLAVSGVCGGDIVTEYFDTDYLPTDYCADSYHIEERRAAAAAAVRAGVEKAQAGVDEANQTLQVASDTLQAAQDQLAAAQASGDAAAAEAAQAVVDTASANYNMAIAQQAAAVQALQEAQAAATAAAEEVQAAQDDVLSSIEQGN